MTRASLGTLSLLLLSAGFAGCDDSQNPASPSATPADVPAASVAPAVDTPGVAAVRDTGATQAPVDALLSAPDGSTLKSTAPTPTSPINNGEASSLTPLLTIANAQGKYASAQFQYRFEVFRGDGSGVLVDFGVVEQGSGSTSYSVSIELDEGAAYQWRARAVFDNERGPWSLTATFQTPTLVVIEAPAPTMPINGATAASLRPDLTVQNGAVSGNAGAVVYQYHLDDEGPSFPNPVLIVASRSVTGTTSAQFEDTLAPDTQFWWRVRATNGTVTTNWSVTVTFTTPSTSPPPPAPPGPGPSPPPPGPTGGPRTPDPAPGTQLPLPNQAALVEQIAQENPGALANSCIEEGGSWLFMDLVVVALRATDTRWGYNCKRGNRNDPSIDVVAYFHGIGDGQQSTQVYLIDVINAVCPGGNQAPDWIDQTQATADEGSIGRFIFPRPSA